MVDLGPAARDEPGSANPAAAGARAKELLGGKMPNEFTLMDATAKLVAGNVQRRLLRVVLLGVGLAVQMVGNLAAL